MCIMSYPKIIFKRKWENSLSGSSKNDNIIVTLSDKCGGVVIMGSI